MIAIDQDLKDMIISALRYALGRRTYITGEVCDYIMNHPELIDKRVKQVMLNDLENINQYYDENNIIDRPVFICLKIFLENYEIE